VAIALLAGLFCCGLAEVLPAQEVAGGKPERQPMEGQSFTFEMRGKPWGAVFEWLTDKTGTPFIPRDIPTGTFNFIAKKGQKFTIPQIIDIINDGLLLQKYVLINRPTSFTVVPADQEIDPFFVPRITLNELDRHGRTEIVSTILKLKSLSAEETAPEVKKQLGPFGKVVPLAKLNQLLVQDTAGNLARIITVMQEADHAKALALRPPPLALEVVQLEGLDSGRVAGTLKAIFPGSGNLAPYIESDPARNAVVIKGTAEQVADIKAAIRSLGDSASDNLRVITLDKGSGPAVADALRRLLSEIRPENPVRLVPIGSPKKE
jgi:type II secretory pathway component GspD/PulD (secretin)